MSTRTHHRWWIRIGSYITALVVVLGVYAVRNYTAAENYRLQVENGYQRYKAAMLRHLLEYEKGNRIDEETKVNHLAAVAWNAIAMLYLDKRGKGKVNDNK